MNEKHVARNRGTQEILDSFSEDELDSFAVFVSASSRTATSDTARGRGRSLADAGKFC